jgi:NTP pyrophosphatase (non-canonical NTP hydrolase)
MDINELCEKAHENAVQKGFYDKPLEIGTLLMLVVSELGEALEADRKNDKAEEGIARLLIDFASDSVFKNNFKSRVKDTFEDELADAVIRIADIAGYLKIDLDAQIQAKMRYNSTRERLHGKEY